MDKNILLLIFVLFLLSSQLLNASWTVMTAAGYIIIAVFVLNTVSPDASSSLKAIITRIINLDLSLFTSLLSNVAKFILSCFANTTYKGEKVTKVVAETKNKMIRDGRKYVEDLYATVESDPNNNDYQVYDIFNNRTTTQLK